MNVKAVLLTGMLLPVFLCLSPAQETVQVSPPSLSLADGKVLIEYRILHAAPSQTFSIRIEVTGQGGNQIAARSLSGDIGSGITGKGDKQITWDLAADDVFLDEEIFVEVYALPEQIPADEISAQDKPEVRTLNRTALIVQSVAFPGLGLSRLHPGQPHWIRGVAAYGCLAGSVYYNRKSWNTYQLYLEPENPDEVQDLFDQAYDMKKTSRILGYAAAGIWAADLVWTILGTSGMDKLSWGTKVDPLTGTPLLALRIKF